MTGDESFDGVWLRLTGTEPGTCRVSAGKPAVESGLCTPAIPVRSPALAHDESLAYLAVRRTEADGVERRWELGAIGHGPNGQALADRLRDQIVEWGHNRTTRPIITARRTTSPNSTRTDHSIIVKPESTLRVSCPAGAQ